MYHIYPYLIAAYSYRLYLSAQVAQEAMEVERKKDGCRPGCLPFQWFPFVSDVLCRFVVLVLSTSFASL